MNLIKDIISTPNNHISLSSIKELQDDLDLRLVSRVLTLYYFDNLTQAEIGRQLNLSTSKVNRLLKFARQNGLVEIKINIPPYNTIFELEKELESITNIQKVIIAPAPSDDPQQLKQLVGKMAAQYISESITNDDVVSIGGGSTIYAILQEMEPQAPRNIKVVPALGGVQGRHETDVNNLADEFAKKFSGYAFQLHAPAFADSPAERDALLQVRQIQEVLELARHSNKAIIGIGTINEPESSFFRFTSLTPETLQAIQTNNGGVGEILAHIYNAEGKPCAPEYGQRVVGLNLTELKQIPQKIGIAATEAKALPIAAALKGGYIDILITDERAAGKVLQILSQKQ